MSDDRKATLGIFPVILILVCCVLWGFQQVAIKSVANEISPVLQTTIRSVGAAILAWLWLSYKKIPILKKDGTFWSGVLAGVLFAMEFLCLYSALEYTDASRVIVFLYIAPFIVAALLAWLVPAERLSKLQTVGLICAFLAVAFAFQDDLAQATKSHIIGDLLAIAAAITWALTTVTVRVSALSRAPHEKTLFYQLTVSAVVMVLYCIASNTALPSSLSPIAIASLIYQTVLVAGLSYLAWFWLLRHYLATKVSSFGFLTPVCGIAFSILFLNEPVSIHLLVAVLGVTLGIYLVNSRRRF